MIRLVGKEAKRARDNQKIGDGTLKDLIKFLFLYTRQSFEFGETDARQAQNSEKKDLDFYEE